jgi:hypothetical protein
MNPWIFCCLLLSGANQVHERTPVPDEFPPEIMLPVDKHVLLVVPKVPEWKDPDWEVLTNPFFPSPSPFNLHGTDDQWR